MVDKEFEKKIVNAFNVSGSQEKLEAILHANEKGYRVEFNSRGEAIRLVPSSFLRED